MKNTQIYTFLATLLLVISIVPMVLAVDQFGNPEYTTLNSITENLQADLSPEFNPDPLAENKLYMINAQLDEDEVTFQLGLSRCRSRIYSFRFYTGCFNSIK